MRTGSMNLTLPLYGPEAGVAGKEKPSLVNTSRARV
jgi:hypothetical protein